MTPYYQDDWATIYCGDCREILPELPKVDLVLTDPPYGVDITKSNRLSVSRGRGAEAWDGSAPDVETIKVVLESGRDAIIWGGNYFSLPVCRGYLIWDKQNDGRDFGECEFAWSSLDAVPRIHRQRAQGMDGGKVHTTQKPLDLFKWCLSHFPEAQTILDPFIGSGTTLRAAKDLNRHSIGIEIEEKYCEIAAKRLAQEVMDFTAQEAAG